MLATRAKPQCRRSPFKAMNEDFYIGGYFLVKPANISSWQNMELLPEIIYTPSDCICDLYPGSEGLSWTSDSKENKKKWEQELNLSDEDAINIRKFCDELFESERLGWSSVFLDLESIDSFKSLINPSITKDWKILCIATTQNHINDFDQEENLNDGQDGICIMLRKEILCPDIMNGFRGFEILGFEYGGCHTFMCNSLETVYSTKLNISFNKNGLIDNFEDAEKAADYTNSPEVGAEPVLWQPWAIIEITEANNLLHRSAKSRAR